MGVLIICIRYWSFDTVLDRCVGPVGFHWLAGFMTVVNELMININCKYVDSKQANRLSCLIDLIPIWEPEKAVVDLQLLIFWDS